MNLSRTTFVCLVLSGVWLAVARAQHSPFEPRGMSEGGPSAREVKVFQLRYAQAESAVRLLKQFTHKGTFVADPRTNTLIAQGSPDELKMVEALLMRLDQQTPEPSDESKSERIVPSLDRVWRNLSGDYSSKQQQVAQLAQALATETDAESNRDLRDRLRVVVTEAFNLRQELQHVELELLRERMSGIESQLQQRERLRDQIIAHRVEQLASGVTTVRSSPPTESTGGTRVHVYDQAPPEMARLRGPEEYQRAAADVHRELQQLEAAEKKLGPNHPNAPDPRTAAALRSRLNLIRDEYAAQLRLLELSVQETEAAWQAAQRDLERVKVLYQSGLTPVSTMDKSTLAHEQANVQLEKAKTLLDLYRKAGATAELLVPDSKDKDKDKGNWEQTLDESRLTDDELDAALTLPATQASEPTQSSTP